MCLILQRTRVQVKYWGHANLSKKQVKKGCSLKLDRFLTNSYLLRLNSYSTDKEFVEIYEKQIFSSDFHPIYEYVFGISFLTTLDIYKAYFKGHHIWEYKKNTYKRWPMPYSLKKKLLRLCTLRFCNQVLLDLHCWWSEELCSQQSSSSWWVSHVLGSMQQKG